MSTKGQGHVPVTRESYAKHKTRFDQKMADVSWAPRKGATESLQSADKKPSLTEWSSAPSLLTSEKDVVKITASVKKIIADEVLLNSDAVMVLDSVREGFMVSMRLFELYCQSSGLDRLMVQNQKSSLLEAQKPEFNKKMQTGSFVAIFAAASYVRWRLADYKTDKTSSITLPFRGIPELQFDNPYSASDCVLYYYGWYLERSQLVRDGLELVKFTLVFFEKILEELATRLPSMEFTEFFSDASYQLEGTEFVLEGFTPPTAVVQSTQEFNKVQFNEIVGNREAKHYARRIAMRLACYDPVLKRNPWQELGGISSVAMGFGSPGTGKSLQIAAVATLIAEYCNRRGIAFDIAPIKIDKNGKIHFLFWPMPDTLVSTFQGGSGENMTRWMKRLHDPDKVIYAPIDDGENNLEERTRQGVSSGVREVIGVFLRYTEGAYAINRGNWVIDIMTNLPEQIDKAILSRIQGRFAIDGATTVVDFVDQDYLWWSKIQKIAPEFVDIEPLPGYTYLSSQADLSSLTEIESDEIVIEDARVKKIVEAVRKNHKITEAKFFGELYERMKQQFPKFTSRDVRNIQKAVSIRMMDFDCPDEWFDKHDLFFGKTFDERLTILKDLMKQNVKGMSLSDLRYREAIKYLQNVSRIESVDQERSINDLLDRAKARQEARERASSLGIDPSLVF